MHKSATEHTFALLTDEREITAAEERLCARFEDSADWSENRLLGFPGGSRERHLRYVKAHDVWLAFNDQLENRWWNGFGLGEPPEGTRATSIDVEINIARVGGNRRIAGAFLRDADGGLYLAHTGKIGGGRKGIGKEAFLEHQSNPRVDADGHAYILVGALDDDELVADVAKFVRSVREFKSVTVEPGSTEDDEDDENVRYPADLFWLFQANPKHFDLVEDLAQREPGSVDKWTVTRLADWMAAGARVLLWQGGAEAGIYAIGTLTGEPELQTGANPYSNGENERRWWRAPFRYDVVLDAPLLKADIKDDDVLSQMLVIRAPQATNFEVEPEEWERIVELLAERGVSVEAALSTEAADAVARLEGWYPDPDIRQLCVAWMADAIETAYATARSSWCATSVSAGKLNVNVGQNRLITLDRGQIRIGLDETVLDASVRDALEGVSTNRYAFKGKAGGALLTLPVAEFATLAGHLTEAFRSLVRASATAFKTSPWHRAHSAALVEAVGHLAGRAMPQPEYAADVQTYWKISPERSASLWPAWKEDGYVAVGWGELGDLSDVDRIEFEERMDRATAKYGWTRSAMDQVWRFSQIPLGARVVTNDGTRRVLGIGTVTQTYNFVEGAEWPHRLGVRWDDLTEREVDRGGWRRTLIKLSASDFEEILAIGAPAETTPEVEEAEAEDALNFDDLCSKLAGAGYYFSNETVASYLLALQAKRFVILSGISGTGKTALALEIAKAFQGDAEASPEASGAADAELYALTVRPYSIKYKRFVVPSALLARNPGVLETAIAQGHVTLRYPKGEQSLRVWKPKQANSLFLMLSGDAADWYTEHYAVDDQFFIRIDADAEGKPVVEIVEVIEADKPRIATAQRRYEVVAVRPDWTDGHGLLGFHNPLTGEYTSTPFLRLLLRASAEQERARRESRPARPYFLILDEMNLARVEHYFSDFLSCLESGESIVLHDDIALEEDEEAVPRRLRVPGNVFFTGTVNVDESTYMFSPKVLDRAFTLEFNEVDLDGYGAATEGDADDDDSPLRLSQFEGKLQVREKPTPKDWREFREREPRLADTVAGLNRVLRTTYRHFGYRVANEIARFMNLALTQAGIAEATKWAAMDVAVLAKALPKLHGTQQELEGTLTQLFAFAVSLEQPGDVKDGEWSLIDGQLCGPEINGIAQRPKLIQTATKLHRMLRRLRTQGFTAFIE